MSPACSGPSAPMLAVSDSDQFPPPRVPPSPSPLLPPGGCRRALRRRARGVVGARGRGRGWSLFPSLLFLLDKV